MYKKKKSSNLGKTRDYQAQVSFRSTSSIEAEMNQDIEANDSKTSYLNKEMIEAQVDSLRLLNQVNMSLIQSQTEDNNLGALVAVVHPIPLHTCTPL